MKLIDRPLYMRELCAAVGTPDIKVITGVRRSGKSKLLEALATHLGTQSATYNIIHVNFNLPEYEALQEYHALYDYVVAHYEPTKENVVLIDEVQMCSGFERAINYLHATEHYDIFITGSNAFLLSSDLATLFTGRTLEVRIYPFSFQEFMTYYALSDRQEAFERYLREGGMSGSYVYQLPSQRSRYVADVFATLIIRDLKQKYRLRNSLLLEKVVDFLMDNVGNLTSSRNIAETLTSHADSINHKTISKYLEYLCQAFAFYKIRRYDVRGKKYLATNSKFYLCDTGFRYARLGTRNLDYGRMLENIVALELLRRGYEVYVGVLYRKEIDFVVLRQDEKLYIQVADDITQPRTFQREVAPLLAIKDAYPKYILARTKHPAYSYEGIKVVDVVEWLVEGMRGETRNKE